MMQESKVMIIMDPCMPEEVEGDLLKFRLIVTSILNFALKSSKKINMKVNSVGSVETNGFILYFNITFKPDFEISNESLSLLFSNEKISLANQTKMNNYVGLSIHLVSSLVQLMGGKFTEIEHKDNGEIYIMFTLPFERIEGMNAGNVRKTDIKLCASRTYENGSHILKSPEINSKVTVMTRFCQESGDEVNDKTMNDYIKNMKKSSSKNNVDIIKDEKSVMRVRDSIRLLEKGSEGKNSALWVWEMTKCRYEIAFLFLSFIC